MKLGAHRHHQQLLLLLPLLILLGPHRCHGMIGPATSPPPPQPPPPPQLSSGYGTAWDTFARVSVDPDFWHPTPGSSARFESTRLVCAYYCLSAGSGCAGFEYDQGRNFTKPFVVKS